MPAGNPPGTNRNVHRGKSDKPTGARKSFYLAPDLVDRYETIPAYKRSSIVNEALREFFAKMTRR